MVPPEKNFIRKNIYKAVFGDNIPLKLKEKLVKVDNFEDQDSFSGPSRVAGEIAAQILSQ